MKSHKTFYNIEKMTHVSMAFMEVEELHIFNTFFLFRFTCGLVCSIEVYEREK